MPQMEISVDYLIVGAGISGLAFADALLSRSDATMAIIDMRDAPGGHWNDAYPFVKLHQPSSFYGVESRPLGSDARDREGPNAGFHSLAGGPEITGYCHALMRDRLLPSGRVRYLPRTRVEADGTVCHLLSGARTHIAARRKRVDATRYTNSIPLTHRRGFAVAEDVVCIPPNDLPRMAANVTQFTVLGGGKTGMDSCLWLLGGGVAPDRIRWVVPRDQWFVNRARVQPGEDFFDDALEGFVRGREDIAAATSAIDLALRHERSGLWLRLDPRRLPEMFHAAHVSEGELAVLRQIEDVVRLGRVRAIDASRLHLERGSIEARAGTLYVDCTASALAPVPAEPVFQPGRIVLQAIRFPQIPFSAAYLAVVETTFDEDAEKNRFAAPVPVTMTVEDYIRGLVPDLENRLRAASEPRLREWIRQSRLDGFARQAAQVDPADASRQALLRRVRQSTEAAYGNLPRLLDAITDASAG